MKDKLAQLIHECEIECLKANLHFSPERIAAYLIEKGAFPPCKIGDKVWIIRNYHSTPIPQMGYVSEILFVPTDCKKSDLKIHIVVKYVGRGEWGKNIFATKEDAEMAINNKKGN